MESLLSTLMQYVDTAMVGRLGASATAAVSTTTTVTWLINAVPAAFSVATMTLVSRAVGSRDNDEIKAVAKKALKLSLLVGLIIEVICLVLSPFIPAWMGAEKAIRHNASVYFAIICLPLVIKSMNIVLASAVRATKDTVSPMIIGLVANGLNLVFDYICIYMLNMGVIGAAVATLASTVIQSGAMYVVFRRNELLHFEFGSVIVAKENITAKILDMAYPILLTNVASCFGYVVFASQVSRMGTIIFAAHSIAVTAEQFFYIGGYGLKTATSTMVGIAYGERNGRKYKLVCKSAVVMTVVMMSLSGLLLYFVATPLMSLFSTDAEVIRLGAAVLRIVAFSEPFFGIYVVTEGIYYGMGRSKYPFVVELIGMWAVRILSTFIVVNVVGGTLNHVWYCMITDNILKALLFIIPLRGLYDHKHFEQQS